MIHVWDEPLSRQVARALADTDQLNPHVDGLIVENYGFGSKDYNLASADAIERIGRITRAISAKTKGLGLAIGINMLPNDYEAAFEIAKTCGGVFIQMDHVTGKFHRCQSVDPAQFLRVRARYPEIMVLGGIHPKYYQLVDPGTTITQSALEAQKLADAIVVTGQKTGHPPDLTDLRAVKSACPDTPLIVGSGLDSHNALEHLSLADGAIVGTAFKTRGVVPGEPINVGLVRAFVGQVAKLR